MTDQVPGATPVKDQRPQPKGVLPRNAQAWLMAALAVGIVAVIVFTGRTTPPVPTISLQPEPTLSADAGMLHEYQVRLRMLDEQARRQSAAPSPDATGMAMSNDSQPQSSGDPMAAEKRRMEYESLFSRVVIRGQPDAPPAISNPSVNGAGLADMPTLDAITEAVMRATQGRTAGAGREPTLPVIVAEGATSSTSQGPAYRLQEGTVIPAVLTNRLDGASAAPVNCLVNSPVYTLDRRHVLIPAGARLLGRTTPVQAFGETRLAVSFHRLVMPDGRSHGLEQFVGLNQRGDAGLRDQVNQHYRSTFGAAAAIGLLSGLSQALGTTGLNAGSGDRTVVVAGAAGETAQVTGRALDRFLNRPPTITIREGHLVHVYVTSDLELPAYESTGAVR